MLYIKLFYKKLENVIHFFIIKSIFKIKFKMFIKLQQWKSFIIKFINENVFKGKTSMLDRGINLLIYLMKLAGIFAILFIYLLAVKVWLKPFSKYFLDFDLTRPIIVLNFISLILFTIFLKIKNRILNYFVLFFSTFIIFCNTGSLIFLGTDVNNTFLVNLFDFSFIKTAFTIQTKLCILAVFFILFVFLILTFLNKKIEINNKKLKLSIIFVNFLILIMPFGFFYRFFLKNNFFYVLDNNKYRDYSANELFKMAKNQDYINNNQIIASVDGKQKNLVIIFLESFDSSYLFNKQLKEYTPFLNDLAKDSEFYYGIQQLNHSDYTTSAIFTVMCGIRYNMYAREAKNKNFKINNKLACLPHILNKIGYKQVYVGGANKLLFDKNVILEMFKYDVIEDNVSILKKYEDFENGQWGVYDVDMFKVAKEHFIRLSNSNAPFSLTILTNATHNDDGYLSKKCQTSQKNKINLSRAIECTDYVIADFINFLKEQPNYKDTLILILPDHVQYNFNTLNKIINKNEKSLYTIFLNSGKEGTIEKTILYTDLAELLLQKLNIKHNILFFDSYLNMDYNSKLKLINSNSDIERMFLYKIYN